MLRQRDAPVPQPAVVTLDTIVGGEKSTNRSPNAQEKIAGGNARHAADMWLRYAPTYAIHGLNLSRLMKRPKNRKNDIEAAQHRHCPDEEMPADACSARFMDEKSGKTLVCVFSHRAPPDQLKNVESSQAKAKVFFFWLALIEKLKKRSKFPFYPGASNIP